MGVFHFKKKKYHKKQYRRDKKIIILKAALFLFAFVIILRLFNLQILNHGFYTALAVGQHEIFEKLLAKRGEIYAQSLLSKDKRYPLAINREYTLIYTQPYEIENPEEVAKKLSPILEIPEEELLIPLSKKDDPYEPLAHKVSEDVVSKVKALELSGVYFAPELFRYYPEKNIGSHVLGFVRFDGQNFKGQYGIEGYFEQELKGEPGFIYSNKDAAGRLIAVASRNFQEARDGSDILLTIDYAIEYVACNELNKAALKHGADAGALVIVEPLTGKVLAMCSWPDFDPNNYNKVDDLKVFNNQAIFGGYEPGSIFKPITMAGALDQGKITPTSTYVDKGFRKIGGFTIKNSDGKVYGEKTMIEVLEDSINTGAIYVVEKLGNELFRDYVEKFGFGQLTNIELPSEVPGNISSLYKPGDVYMATASFGQGVTVTPLQMVMAYAAIANSGILMRPYIVDKIIQANGQVLKAQPKEIRQVISSRAATLLSGMLVSVIEEGHAKLAKVPGYYLAGKTGTAQVPDYENGGYSDKTIHSFVGFGPVDNPRFAMIIRLDNPKDLRYAASSVAPVFGTLAKFILNYLEVEPDY